MINGLLPFFQVLWCTIPGSNCISTNTWIILESSADQKLQTNPVRWEKIKVRRWIGDDISLLSLLLVLAARLLMNPEDQLDKVNLWRGFKVFVISVTIYLYIPMQSIPYCLRAERKSSWYFPSSPYLANGPSTRLIWPTLHNDEKLQEITRLRRM